MISSYEVGAIFRIVNDASPTLERIASQLRGLDGLIASAKKELSSLGSSFGGGLVGRIESAGNALKGLDTNAGTARTAIGALADSMASIGGAADRAVGAADVALGRLDERIEKSAAALKSLDTRGLAGPAGPTAVTRAAAESGEAGALSGLRARGTGGGGHGGGLHGRISASPGGIHPHIGGSLGGDDMVPMSVAAAGYEYLKHAVTAGLDMTSLEAQARTNKITASRIDDLVSAAWKNAKDFPNVTATESLRYG